MSRWFGQEGRQRKLVLLLVTKQPEGWWICNHTHFRKQRQVSVVCVWAGMYEDMRRNRVDLAAERYSEMKRFLFLYEGIFMKSYVCCPLSWHQNMRCNNSATMRVCVNGQFYVNTSSDTFKINRFYHLLQEVGITLQNMELVLHWEYTNMRVLVIFSSLTQPKRKFLLRPFLKRELLSVLLPNYFLYLFHSENHFWTRAWIKCSKNQTGVDECGIVLCYFSGKNNYKKRLNICSQLSQLSCIWHSDQYNLQKKRLITQNLKGFTFNL